MIKALITGPEGTPYVRLELILRCNLTLHSFWKIPQWLVCGIHLAHSLRRKLTVPLYSYLFDIFLGASYNQSPPSVKYMTVRSAPEHKSP